MGRNNFLTVNVTATVHCTAFLAPLFSKIKFRARFWSLVAFLLMFAKFLHRLLYAHREAQI